MTTQNITLLSILGIVIWILGTILFAYSGRALLETTGRLYWIAFFLSPVISAVFCIAILWWRRISYADWAAAMLLLALPGMIGETVVLSHFSTFMPKLQATSGGKYGAFLFATYAVVLAIAEAVTLKAR